MIGVISMIVLIAVSYFVILNYSNYYLFNHHPRNPFRVYDLLSLTRHDDSYRAVVIHRNSGTEDSGFGSTPTIAVERAKMNVMSHLVGRSRLVKLERSNRKSMARLSKTVKGSSDHADA